MLCKLQKSSIWPGKHYGYFWGALDWVVFNEFFEKVEFKGILEKPSKGFEITSNCIFMNHFLNFVKKTSRHHFLNNEEKLNVFKVVIFDTDVQIRLLVLWRWRLEYILTMILKTSFLQFGKSQSNHEPHGILNILETNDKFENIYLSTLF